MTLRITIIRNAFYEHLHTFTIAGLSKKGIKTRERNFGVAQIVAIMIGSISRKELLIDLDHTYKEDEAG